MKIVKLDINLDSILAGIDAVALVEQPAIEEDFIYFSKHKPTTEREIIEEIIRQEMSKTLPPQIEEPVKTSFAALDEQQMVLGPLMKANKLILRLDENNEEYYVYFSPESIKKIAYKMMEEKLIDKVNIEHDDDRIVEDAFLVESWIVEDPEHDKATKYGFTPNKGDWYGSYKIKNDRVWNDLVKTGKVKGYSVQGYFESYAEKMSSQVCSISKGKQCGCGKSESGICDGSHLK